MTDMQLNRLMKKRYLISPKLISEGPLPEDLTLFSDKNFSFATNEELNNISDQFRKK